MGFYTYLYLREDGTSYYVGKGMGKRAFSSQHWVPVPPKERILIESHASEEEALEAEKLLISYYGRKNNKTGILRNLTNVLKKQGEIIPKQPKMSCGKSGQRFIKKELNQLNPAGG